MRYDKSMRDKNNKPFVMLPIEMLKSEKWKNLGPAAKLYYVHLKAKYNGSNNGIIKLHYSELRGVRGISAPGTISNAIKELVVKGWIYFPKLEGKFRHPNEYWLTGKYDGSLS